MNLDGEVEAQVADEGKWFARCIQPCRREDRLNFGLEITRQPIFLASGELWVVQDANALFLQFRQQPMLEMVVLLAEEGAELLVDCLELFSRRASVNAEPAGLGRKLCDQGCHPDHKELVEIIAKNCA